MTYLFILESIGTSELILIGLVALIVFGPRKLPELARMLGKAMNEFRRSTDEFKRTWEKEVDFENETVNKTRSDSAFAASVPFEKPVQTNVLPVQSEVVAPEIKEISQTEIENLPKEVRPTNPEPKNIQPNKQDWL